MSTLLLRLAGPMQSWGTFSRFDERDTGKEPSKSGVVGILAAALGIDRENWSDLEPITRLSMAVRHDRPGIFRVEYQTAQNIISADLSKKHETAVTKRQYLADATFLVGLDGGDRSLLERIHAALLNPVWPLSLGRKSYVPSEQIWIKDGVVDAPFVDVLFHWPWIASLRKWESPPKKLLISVESKEGLGLLRMDQPLSSFSERRFGLRFVQSQWMPFPEGPSHDPE